MSFAIAKLPAELIPMICEHLDSASLKNLRLSNKFLFNEDARNILFSDLLLYPNSLSHAKLVQLSQNVVLSKLVKRLTYCGSMMYYNYQMENDVYEWFRGIKKSANRLADQQKLTLEELTPEMIGQHGVPDPTSFFDMRNAWVRYRNHCETQKQIMYGTVEEDNLFASMSKFENLQEVLFESHRPWSPTDRVMLETFVQRSGDCAEQRHGKQLVRTVKAINRLQNRTPLSLTIRHLSLDSLINGRAAADDESHFSEITACGCKVLDISMDGEPFWYTYDGRNSHWLYERLNVLFAHLQNVEELRISCLDPSDQEFASFLDVLASTTPQSTGPTMQSHNNDNNDEDDEDDENEDEDEDEHLNIAQSVVLGTDVWKNLKTLHLENMWASKLFLSRFFETGVPKLQRLSLKNVGIFAPALRHDEGSDWAEIFHVLQSNLQLSALSLAETFSVRHGAQTEVWKATRQPDFVRVETSTNDFKVRDDIETFVTHKGEDPFEELGRDRFGKRWQSPTDKSWTLIESRS